MLNDFFIYLAKSTISLMIFALAYRFLFTRLTYFQWRRVYLLSALILSCIIPLIPLSFLFVGSGLESSPIGKLVNENLRPLNLTFNPTTNSGESSLEEAPATTGAFFLFLSYAFFSLYIAVCAFKTWRFQQNLKIVYRLIKKSRKEESGEVNLLRTRENLPAFSFLNYVFIPAAYDQLDKEEIGLVIQHERIHVRQKHTLDLLLYEIAGIFFWFNPALYYLQSSIRQVHEYLVDSTITQTKGLVKKYGELLIKLATQPAEVPFLNTFSNQQFKDRIFMLTKNKSNPMAKLRFLITIPVLGLTLALCSCFEQETPAQAAPPEGFSDEETTELSSTAQELVIRKISWTGNEMYSDEELTKVLGFKVGDAFKREEFNQRFSYNPEGNDISALYMDKGYLFFYVTPEETYSEKTVDLDIVVSEGPQATNGKVIVKGNKKIKSEEIMQKISVRAGELFDRSKIIESQAKILEMGYFKPESIEINPTPYQEADGSWKVDWEFRVEEL